MPYTRLLHFNLVPLHILDYQGRPCLDSRALSLALGYHKADSIRQQVLRKDRWKQDFKPGQDLHVLHEPSLLAKLDQSFMAGRPTKPSHGLVVLTYSGIQKVCQKTAFRDAGTELLRFLEKEAPFIFEHIASAVTKAQASLKSKPQAVASEPATRGAAESSLTKTQDERKFQYEVLQRLLSQLQEIQDPSLRELAILSAEVALGRPLREIRGDRNTSAISSTSNKSEGKDPTPTPPPELAGPIFENAGWYSCREIGEMAGGYTRVQAGKAVDIVGGRVGFSHEQLRQKELPFNRLVLKQVGRMKKPQILFSFNREFANKVIHELRRNPEFIPPELSSENKVEVRNLIAGPFGGKPPRLSDWGSEI